LFIFDEGPTTVRTGQAVKARAQLFVFNLMEVESGFGKIKAFAKEKLRNNVIGAVVSAPTGIRRRECGYRS
jgi:hypothetical protein